MHTGKKESLHTHRVKKLNKLTFNPIHFLNLETKMGNGNILQVLPLRINYTIGILAYAFFPYLYLLKFYSSNYTRMRHLLIFSLCLKFFLGIFLCVAISCAVARALSVMRERWH